MSNDIEIDDLLMQTVTTAVAGVLSVGGPVGGALVQRVAQEAISAFIGGTNGAGRAGHWVATHQHRKGNYYRVLTRGLYEANMMPVVIYDDAEGRVWVRPAVEFDDGRFKPVR